MTATFRPPSACQLRAARAALNWSCPELARLAGIGANTLRRMEGLSGLPTNAMVATVGKVRRTLEAAGIGFLEDDRGREGVTFPPQVAALIRRPDAAPGKLAPGTAGNGPLARRRAPGGGSDHH